MGGDRDYKDDDEYDPDDFRGTGPGRHKREPDAGYDVGRVTVIHETDSALLVRGAGLSSDPFGLADPNEESWVPKSQVHPRSELQADCGINACGAMTITRWLASKRGLV